MVPPTVTAQKPPGPKGYPLLGVLPLIWRDPLGFFQQVAHEYGDVARVGLGRYTLYLVTSPDLIKYILQDNQENYWKGRGLAAAEPLLGQGLATSEGELWQRQHRMIQPLFSYQRLTALIPLLLAATGEMLNSWRQRPRGEPLDIAREMQQLTLKTMCRTLFGDDICSTKTAAVCQAVTVSSGYIKDSAWRWIPLPKWVPTPSDLRFRRHLRILDGIVHQAIRERQRSSRQPDDMLGQLLSARDEETGLAMDERLLRDETMTLLIAGHETPAVALAWSFYLLGKNPQVALRLEEEVDEVLGSDQSLTERQLSQLVYTEQVLKESMRLFPPSWVIARTPRRNDMLGGYFVPKDTCILLSQYVVHRHPALWVRPTEFCPDRWTPQETTRRHRYSYFPFGGGARICAGKVFAMMMMKLIVARVVQSFRLKLVPDQKVKAQPLTTLHPESGIKVFAEERKIVQVGKDLRVTRLKTNELSG